MASSIITYEQKCKNTIGSIKTMYLMEYVFYNETLATYEGMNLITFPTTTVYKFDCEGSYSQDTAFDLGNVSFNHTVNVNLSKVYNVIDAHIFTTKDYRILVHNNNDELILFGALNGLVGSMSNTSGTAKAEFNGFNITFTGLEETTGLLVNDFDDFFTTTPAGVDNVFNYDLSFSF